MFNEWLEQHRLLDEMKGTAGCPFPCFSDRKAWGAVAPELLAELRSMADTYRVKPYEVLKASQFLAYVRDGSRKAYENPYFDRRRKMICAALGCCATGSLEDLDDVIDGLWLICEETSWVISAHNGSSHDGMRPAVERPLPNIDNPYIDLFAAQTAMILSLVIHLLGDELDAVTPLIRRRVRAELEKRILVPFATRDDYWWMGFIRKDLCNWTPWIVSNVMYTAVCNVSDRIRLSELLARGCRMLDRWLDVVPQDGGCDEGAAYWNMAGAALLDCLELMEQVTGGAMTFWQDEKIANMLRFPMRARLENGWFINFADCDARPAVNGERLQLAGEKLGDADLLRAGVQLHPTAWQQLADVPHMWRLMSLLFHPVCEVPAAKAADRDVWFPNLQVRILQKNGLILACKGGHNGESHNHNDVGSFMLYADGEPVAVDAGNMVYTAKTFSDRRYELWNVRSVNHNVPMIDCKEQLPGTRYAASDVQCLPDGLQLRMDGAYDVDGMVCARRLQLTNQGLILHDVLTIPEAKPVTWVFMLRNKPAMQNGRIRTGSCMMEIPEGLKTEWQQISVEDPRMAASYPGSLWRVTCTAEPAIAHDAVFTIRKQD